MFTEHLFILNFDTVAVVALVHYVKAFVQFGDRFSYLSLNFFTVYVFYLMYFPLLLFHNHVSTDVISHILLQAIDTEALGLLSWLASSQAIEELNTDDELVHEAILSPILSTKSFKQALEIAHLDYENASQQKCLDILDSICDDEKFVELREQTSWPTYFDDKVSDALGNVIQ